MKSKRLTKEIRSLIAASVLRKAFAADEKKVIKSDHALALAFYNDRYSERQQKAMLEFDQSDMAFTYNDRYSVRINGRYVQLKLDKPRPFWYRHSDKYRYYKSGCALGQMWESHLALVTKIDGEKAELKNEINAITGQCTTTKQLLELWPESFSILIELGVFAKPAPVPMKSPDKLNKIICNKLGKGDVLCFDKEKT